MTYVKIDDDIFRNPKVVRVSTVAKLIYVASICYCGNQLTDGFIPRNAARTLSADAGVNYSPKIVKELINAGLWLESEDGYTIHDYLEHNESAKKVQAKKAAARERMERVRSGKVRANNERTSGNVGITTTTTDASPNGEEDISPKPPPSAPNYSDEFEAFWAGWPKGKGNKKKAWEQWKRLRPDADLQAVIRDRVQEWKQTRKWREGFITHAERWLRDRGWEDDLPEETTPMPATGWQVHNGGVADNAPIVPGPRGYTPDQLRRLSEQLKEQERLRETS